MTTPEAPTSTTLLGALRSLPDARRRAFRQERTFRWMQALLFGQLFCFARRTVTQALVTLGFTDHDWFYRPRLVQLLQDIQRSPR